MKGKKHFECEAWVGGQWSVVPVKTVLVNPSIKVRRCLECKGYIKLHKAGPGNRPRAHAEHLRRFPGCSLGDSFDGTHRPNPDRVPTPKVKGKLHLIPEEVTDPKIYWEGATARISVNRYERNKEARDKCLRHHGLVCSVCGKTLSEIYGAAAEGVIHVHHLLPLASIGKGYEVDPLKDLTPVCPNCHAVIHSRNPCYEIDEVKRMLKTVVQSKTLRRKRN